MKSILSDKPIQGLVKRILVRQQVFEGWRTLTVVAALLFLAAGTQTLLAQGQGPKGPKSGECVEGSTLLCHMYNNGKTQIICVGPEDNGLSDHEDHGDSVVGDEICDGIDNDCDGEVDEGGDALCDDGDACTNDICESDIGCVNPPVNCDDADACTADSCDPASGCVNEDISCDDGQICTDDSCNPGFGCDNVENCDEGEQCNPSGTGECVECFDAFDYYSTDPNAFSTACNDIAGCEPGTEPGTCAMAAFGDGPFEACGGCISGFTEDSCAQCNFLLMSSCNNICETSFPH